MRIVFSRKGFDSGSGGKPSPILDGMPISLPIPGTRDEPFTYDDISLGGSGSLGPLVADVTKGRITGARRAHYDPQLPMDRGIASLGQQGAAQAHLINQGVGPGDVFIFFGLFRDYDAPRGHADAKPHHRIFGMMHIDRVCLLGDEVRKGDWRTLGLPVAHPHTERAHMLTNNTIWIGQGQLARTASDTLRLSTPAGPPSTWRVPAWLTRKGLSYHTNPDRWQPDTLKLVARGQEFVSDIDQDPEALAWIRTIQAALGQKS